MMDIAKKQNRAALTVAVAAALGLSGAVSAQMQVDNPGVQGGDLPDTLGGSITLWDQTDLASGNGAPDQDFEAVYDVYDAEGADDFVVPAGLEWTIEEVGTVGIQAAGGTATSVDITFYEDAGGLPGAAIAACTYPGVTPVETAGSFEITLPVPCVLGEGTYWLGQQTNQDVLSNDQHFWSNRTAANGNNAAWRNPGDGFGSGCTDWDAMTTCGVGGGTNPDFLFALSGTEGEPAPPLEFVPVPTLNRWGLGALAVFLTGLTGWVLSRRRRDGTA